MHFNVVFISPMFFIQKRKKISVKITLQLNICYKN